MLPFEFALTCFSWRDLPPGICIQRGGAKMAKVINDQNKIRHYGIGIDSGGTFTDGVIIDLSNGTIIKTVKVRTTHHRLLTESATACSS